MAKRRVIDMETGEEIEDESPEKVVIPKSGVKRTGRVKRVKAPSLGLALDPALKPEPGPKLDPDPGPALVEEVAVEAPQSTFEQVKIVCLRPSRRSEVGRVTGNEYVFERGEPVPVDVRDVGYMKATKRGSRGCGAGETRVFVELAEL